MEHQPNAETEVLSKPDNFASEHGALIQSRDYGDIRVFPDIDVLNQLDGYWKNELNNPNRSPRGKKEINKIIGRLTFEIHAREYPARKDVIADLESVFKLAAFSTEPAEAYHSQEQRAA